MGTVCASALLRVLASKRQRARIQRDMLGGDEVHYARADARIMQIDEITNWVRANVQCPTASNT